MLKNHNKVHLAQICSCASLFSVGKRVYAGLLAPAWLRQRDRSDCKKCLPQNKVFLQLTIKAILKHLIKLGLAGLHQPKLESLICFGRALGFLGSEGLMRVGVRGDHYAGGQLERDTRSSWITQFCKKGTISILGFLYF